MFDEETKQWLKEAAERNVPKMRESEAFMAIVGAAYLQEPVCLLQIGAAVCMDKPLFLIVKNGTVMPESLKKIAKFIVYFDPNDDADFMEKAKILNGKLEEFLEGKSECN